MSSFYWTQAALAIVGAVLAYFISFGPNRSRTRWVTLLGIAAAVALFVANQVVMSITGDGLDKQLNCWINPAGVACPQPKPLEPVAGDVLAPLQPAPVSHISAKVLHDQGLAAYNAEAFVKARALYKQACDGGNARGCTDLGYMWEKAEGGTFDKGLARALYKRGCDGGDAMGCGRLGDLWEKGEGGGGDAVVARALYKQACDSGNAHGCQGLGFMWELGKGGDTNKTMARNLYKQACDSGEVKACYNAAIMFELGEGGRIDGRLARAFHKLACEDGNIVSCLRLAWMLERGEGGGTDKNLARVLYKRACDAEEPHSCTGLDRLNMK